MATQRVLPVRTATPETFSPYGYVVSGREAASHGPEDEALDLSAGRPRFYILRLPKRGRVFRDIARHCRVTQCLAAVGGAPWLLGVAPPRDLDDPRATPVLEEIEAFEVPGDVFVLLHRGTWHAGPYFEEARRDFFDLELQDTNDNDLTNVDLEGTFGVTFAFGERAR